MTTTAHLFTPLARYAERLHAAVGTEHHVASPLGAWLLLALCGPASAGIARDELTAVLGLDAGAAGEVAAELLSVPHPQVLSAAALWYRRMVEAAAFVAWRAGLPTRVEIGDIPSQAEADRWAGDRTLGMVDRFPLQLPPDVVLVLATALATRVSWDRPFEVVPAAALGAASGWAGGVRTALSTPDGPEHVQYIATTQRAGEVAVHTARARGGLRVTSVIAAPEVPAGDVLAVAYEIAHAAALGEPVPRRSLFDLPVGESPLWTITERSVPTRAHDGREQRCRAVLPAWSTRSQHDLTGHTELGFPAAAQALADVLELDEYRYQAAQSAFARYSRVGFEAAAVTGIAVALAYAPYRDGILREAQLRFGHPYAVVAVAVDPDIRPPSQPPSPWHGVPVFSAWVTEVEDAGPDQDDNRPANSATSPGSAP